MGLQAESWIMNIGRSLFAAIDYVVYSLIKWILFGIFDLANLTTSSGLLNDIYSRIYVLLGVFMAFKLSFSFIQYMIDPDSMTGKSEKGVSKLIMRIAIMILALVGLPGILFGSDGEKGLISRAQEAFLPMLPRILLGISEDSGVSVDNGSNTDDIANSANTMAVSTLQAFFYPPDELDTVCGEGTIENTPTISSIEEFVQNVNLSCANGLSGDLLIWHYGAPKYYQYSYTFIVSTVVGVLLIVMLLGITIDVAKRVFKMIILEVIAPIPIMSLIDPKSSKDGAFSKWVKTLISTFIDIFLKLGLVYLVLMLIQLIVNNGLFENFPEFSESPIRATYLTVFLILGLIYFAKEAPKFIKDSLGIKDSGAGLGTGLGASVGALGGLVAGHSLSGMATGAIAGASADPKVGAYAAGRDKAGQIRRGDANWKGGFAANLERFNANRAANKLGLSEANVKAADDYAKGLEKQAAAAERNYQQLLHSGATGDELATARKDADELEKQAAEARKNADKGKQDREALKAPSTKTSISNRRATIRKAPYNAIRDKAGEAHYGSKEAYNEISNRRAAVKAARTEYRDVRTSVRNSAHGRFDPRNGNATQDDITRARENLDRRREAVRDFDPNVINNSAFNNNNQGNGNNNNGNNNNGGTP